MLVLSRREDEKLVFPNLGITITIAKICGTSVRVGVDAPRHPMAEPWCWSYNAERRGKKGVAMRPLPRNRVR